MLQRLQAGVWQDVNKLEKNVCVGGVFADCEFARREQAGAWVDVWSSKIYPITYVNHSNFANGNCNCIGKADGISGVFYTTGFGSSETSVYLQCVFDKDIVIRTVLMHAQINGSLGNNNTYNTYQFSANIGYNGGSSPMQGIDLSYPCYVEKVERDLSASITSKAIRSFNMYIRAKNQRMSGFLSFLLTDIRAVTENGSIIRCGVVNNFYIY